MESLLSRAGALLLVLGVSGAAHAHALWSMPRPRDNRDGWKETAAGFAQPCGVARKPTQPVTAFMTGSTFQVRWTETVNHPGCFLIDFSPDDTQFTMLANVKHMATGMTPRPWQTMITLPPGVRCDSCTLRLRQVMLGSEAQACPPPGGIPADTTYYSCANVVIADTVPDGGAITAADASAMRDAGLPDRSAATPDAAGSGGGGGRAGSGGATGMGGMAPAGGGNGGGTSTEPPMTTAPPPTKHASGGCTVAVGGGPGAGVLLVVVAALLRRLRNQRAGV